ncbi:MAG: hypothetical protein BWY75_01963 [bacterium ADurb.Bin425]|nr:MAG: hypothetical protein BWY75_01963 [bacterium ADurb.Bin425]
MQKPTARDSGTKSALVTPVMKKAGTNTAIMESIANRRGTLVSKPAFNVALVTGSPLAIWAWMFSISTVASSTRMPIASARPERVCILMV